MNPVCSDASVFIMCVFCEKKGRIAPALKKPLYLKRGQIAALGNTKLQITNEAFTTIIKKQTKGTNAINRNQERRNKKKGMKKESGTSDRTSSVYGSRASHSVVDAQHTSYWHTRARCRGHSDVRTR